MREPAVRATNKDRKLHDCQTLELAGSLEPLHTLEASIATSLALRFVPTVTGGPMVSILALASTHLRSGLSTLLCSFISELEAGAEAGMIDTSPYPMEPTDAGGDIFSAIKKLATS